MKRSTLPDLKKLLLWITAFSLIFHVAAWIQVWPIALRKSAEILTYVDAANVYIIAMAYFIVAPPTRYLAVFTFIPTLVFLLPLFIVSYKAGDRVIFNVIVNDSLLSVGFGSLSSFMMDRLRRQITLLKVEKEIEASKFLGPVLSKAIFEDKREHLRRMRCKGFIVSIDVRDSTGMQQRHRDNWLSFRQRYFSMVSQLVTMHGGYIQKTVGDCHVINFGVMDYGVDLSDIPGIENELRSADERRLQRASNQAFAFVNELFSKNEELSKSCFSGNAVYLGVGMDKGWVERGVQGDSVHSLELDVNGDPVNCSNRLQDYSKIVLQKLGWESSILVISPFASDYLPDLASFVRVQTIDRPVRNYPGIKWVLVRRHQNESKVTGKAA